MKIDVSIIRPKQVHEIMPFRVQDIHLCWIALVLLLSSGVLGRAQWTGAAGDNDFNNTANWTSGTINGTFSGLTAATTLQFESGSTASLATLSLDTGTTTGVTVTLGTGTLISGTSSATINLSTGIVVPRVSGDVVVIGGVNASAAGSDLILNMNNLATSSLSLGYVATTGSPTTKPVLVLNAQLTGAGSKHIQIPYVGGAAPAVVFANNNNAFDASIETAGQVFFTSVSSVGGGASSLGAATTAARGTMQMDGGGQFVFIGTANQSTDRVLSSSYASSTVIANASATPTTITFSGNVSVNGNAASTTTFQTYASSGNKIVFSGVISNGSTTTTSFAVINGSGNSIYNNGWKTTSGNGTIILTAANTYTGGTSVSAGGKLYVNNASGSGTGTGKVTVAATGILGGTGTINPTGANAITISGVLAPGDENGSAAALTLSALGTSLSAGTPLLTLASSATLAVSLNSGLTASSLNLTNSYTGEVQFTSNVINFTDLTSGSLSAGLYTFIVADSANAYLGLTLGSANAHGGSYITGGLTIGSGLSAYSSQLELNGNAIQLEIVPEPTVLGLLLATGMLLIITGDRVRRKRLA